MLTVKTVKQAFVKRVQMYCEMVGEFPESKSVWFDCLEEIFALAMYCDLITPEQYEMLMDLIFAEKYGTE